MQQRHIRRAHNRAQHQNPKRGQGEFKPMLGQDLFRCAAGQQIDNARDIPDQQDFAKGDAHLQHSGDQHHLAKGFQLIAQKRLEFARRRVGLFIADIGINKVFKVAEHGNTPRKRSNGAYRRIETGETVKNSGGTKAGRQIRPTDYRPDQTLLKRIQ